MHTTRRHRTPALAVLACLVCATAAVVGAASPALRAETGCDTPEDHAARYPVFAAMRAELAPLRPRCASDTPTIRRYYAAASRGAPDIRHDTGTVVSRGTQIAVHIWRPREARGTVFVIHGYLAHPLQHGALIQRLLTERFVVIAPELPGHGLSGGPRGAIESFSDYGAFLNDVLESVEGAVPRPYHVVGHSTGATAILEFLRTREDPFSAVVFVAPLVKSKFYGLSRGARFLSRPFVDCVSTDYDEAIGVSRMPLSWFDRQVDWNQRLDSVPILDREILVLQGTSDRVVAWRRNRRYLQRYPGVEYQLYRGAGHVLFMEAPPVRDAAVDRTLAWMIARTPEGSGFSE